MSRILAFLLVVSSSAPALANSSSFGGAGVDPMPLKNDDVEMVAEHVVLRFAEEHPHDAGSELSDGDWNVSCEFTFRNTSDEAVHLQIGFPFTGTGELDFNEPASGGKRPEGMLVWDFEAKVRGKPVDARVRTVSRNPALGDHVYEKAYLWDVKFGPKETVEMTVTYRHGRSHSVMADWWVTYVLRTGALWKGGKIGRSRLEVHAPRGVWVAPEGLTTPRTLPNPESADWKAWTERPDRSCSRETSYRRQPAGATVKKTKDGVSLYWDLRDFRPTEDLRVDFLQPNFSDPRTRWVTTNCWSDEELAAMSKRELRIARNQIAAIHGYVFESEDLRQHFQQQWWYEPNPRFDIGSLSKAEKWMMKKIKEFEAKKTK